MGHVIEPDHPFLHLAQIFRVMIGPQGHGVVFQSLFSPPTTDFLEQIIHGANDVSIGQFAVCPMRMPREALVKRTNGLLGPVGG